MAEKVVRTKEEILGVLSALAGIYLGISIFTYYKWDPSVFTFTIDPARNSGGVAGAYLADLFITALGYSSYALPAVLLAYAVRRGLARERRHVHSLGALFFMVSFSLMLTLLFQTFSLPSEIKPGGLTGYYLGGFLEKYLSVPGAYLIALSSFFSSIVLLGPVRMDGWGSGGAKTAPEADIPRKGIIEEDIIVRLPEESEGAPDQDELPVQLPLITTPDVVPARVRPARSVSPGPSRDGYILPSLDFMTLYDTSEAMDTDDDKRSNSGQLKTKLADFDVNGNITRIEQGPVITLYEFEPAPGVKITRVVNLADDLALALKAQSIRVSPISGKATIGIEVPNRKRAVVALREIISSDEFNKKHSRLTLALGKNISGNPIVADLTRMPHLLVAGATGAGKSVSINSMVMSILYKATPKEVKLLMIDPKLLELSMYEGIPHLISPIITSPKGATEALRKMVFEMERRYRLLAEKGARNIDSFNSQAGPEERLPYIVVFIDELADLMFASSRDVEDSITRLAQMARAAGIHLIIATQRPSVDVITGLIKANFPARISFQVFSKIDSRTILDSQGAEQLLGKGDMLLLQPGERLIRVHGALVTEPEIKGVTDFIKSQARPDYSFFEEIPAEAAAPEESAEGRDDMYYKAVEFAESAGEVSISSIQRRFKIGYNRAASIMETMADDGLVGPPKGAGKPRDYLGRHS
ncbi:MAG: DNA translocase FtsK 4TM domain-containing protein [Nitrospirae bacterium]|nr:DNA translocase FtsK 4TM domain-containing protein [Nitrospirota bacterium]